MKNGTEPLGDDERARIQHELLATIGRLPQGGFAVAASGPAGPEGDVSSVGMGALVELTPEAIAAALTGIITSAICVAEESCHRCDVEDPRRFVGRVIARAWLRHGETGEHRTTSRGGPFVFVPPFIADPDRSNTTGPEGQEGPRIPRRTRPKGGR